MLRRLFNILRADPELGLIGGVAAVCAAWLWWVATWHTPFASGINADYVRMGTVASSPLGSSAGIYAKASDGKVHLTSTGGADVAAGVATSLVISAGTPGGAVLGDCWADSSAGYKVTCKESAGVLAQRTDLSAPGTIGAGTPGAATFTTLTATSLVLTGGLPLATVTGGADTAVAGGATAYLGAPGTSSSASKLALYVATRTSTARNLRCFAVTAPGGGDSEAYALVTVPAASGAPVAQALTCTISASGTTCSDTTNTVALTAGAAYGLRAVQSATSAAAGVTCSFEVTL